MTRPLRTLIISAAALLVLCAPVGAAPFTPGLERAYKIAERYWGGGPVNCLTLDRQIVPDDSLMEGQAGAIATMPAEPSPCILYVERGYARPSAFGVACAVMIHEVGHLRGLDHSPDPSNVMHPRIEKAPAICLREALRELNRRIRARNRKAAASPVGSAKTG